MVENYHICDVSSTSQILSWHFYLIRKVRDKPICPDLIFSPPKVGGKIVCIRYLVHMHCTVNFHNIHTLWFMRTGTQLIEYYSSDPWPWVMSFYLICCWEVSFLPPWWAFIIICSTISCILALKLNRAELYRAYFQVNVYNPTGNLNGKKLFCFHTHFPIQRFSVSTPYFIYEYKYGLGSSSAF